MNCFKLLLVLIKLEVWLIICLELIFNPVPIFLFSWGFNFTLSAIVFCNENRIDNGDDDNPGLNNFYEDICFVGVLYLLFSI